VIRYVAVLTRRPGTTVEDFLSAWLGDHRELAAALPRVRRVEFLPALSVEDVAQGHDGVGFVDFDSLEDLRFSLASDQALRLRAHTATFADAGATVRLVVAVDETAG